MPKQRTRTRDQDGIYQRPDSPYWWANWTDANGNTARRSTGVKRGDDPRKEKAKAIRAGWIVAAGEERERGPRPTKPAGPTFDELLVLYIDGPSLDKRSHDRDIYSTKRLAPHFAGRELADLKGADVGRYIDARKKDGAAPATINREIGMASAAINWARRRHDWNVPNPFEGWRLAEPPGRDRWLTPEEAAALLRAAEALPRARHLAEFIKLGLYVGMRPGEILGLEWRRVDLSRNVIEFGADNQKSGKTGSVPINERARAAILARARFRASRCPGSPWVFSDGQGERIQSVKKSFQSAVAAAGLTDVHPHDLRRTCGAWMALAGIPIKTIAAILRHSDIRVTDRVYTPLAPDLLREALGVLDSDLVSRSGFTLPPELLDISAK